MPTNRISMVCIAPVFLLMSALALRRGKAPVHLPARNSLDAEPQVFDAPKKFVKNAGAFDVTIKAQTNDPDEALRIETELIAKHNPLCNIEGIGRRAKVLSRTIGMGQKITASLKKALDQAAFDEKRSMSQLIEIWLDEKAREKGYLK
jgi:hypothetical protein